jgi:ParB-like chromosome segregation protein Spo0J
VNTDDDGLAGVKLAFERDSVVLQVAQIVPFKGLRPGVKKSRKYPQIVGSVRSIGLVEAPIVAPDPKHPGTSFLLDGHLRIEALKDLGIAEVECLVSTDDEAYTHNKRINRLAAVQEHRMITRAVERGVSEDRIAEALGLEITRNSLNSRSHEVRRISALRDHFRATWRRGQCSASPA